jgi:phage-related baseplate assembly protein
MPLPQANLDTRRFDDLVAEMRALIPRYAPEWTNHNPSDPGVTLIELLAWVTEATLYRINVVPEATSLEFAKLLLGHDEEEELREQPLAERIGAIYTRYFEAGKETEFKKQLQAVVGYAVKAFHEPYRAVTEEDFAREAARAGDKNVSRVRILSDGAHGQVVVVVVPATGRQPDQTLLLQIKKHLDERRLVGTRVLVRGPLYTAIKLEIKAVVEANTRSDVIAKEVEDRLKKYFHPLSGGRGGSGWPFGRPVSVFELYHLIEDIDGIDHVETIVMNGDSTAREIMVSDLPELESADIELNHDARFS